MLPGSKRLRGSASALFAVVLFLCPAALAQDDGRCGAGQDLVVQALERIQVDQSPPAIDRGLHELNRATKMCPFLGDAWYYLSLFQRKLGRVREADSALKQSRIAGSDALTETRDPFAIAAPESTQPLKPVADKWALVIGIGEFLDTRLKLGLTPADARDMATLLGNPKLGRFPSEHVKMLLNGEATTRNIKFWLNAIARNAKPDDLVVIYIASHGSARSDDNAAANYIITADTEITSQDALFATALPMVDLTNMVRSRITARRTVIILDTCHSAGAIANQTPRVRAHGGIFSAFVASSGHAQNPAAEVTGAPNVNAAVSAETMRGMGEGVGRVIMASSGVGESSWESPKFGHGYFTYYLLQALGQDQGLDSLDRIFTFVRDHVQQSVAAERHATQTPVMARSTQPVQISLGVAPVAPVAAGLEGP